MKLLCASTHVYTTVAAQVFITSTLRVQLVDVQGCCCIGLKFKCPLIMEKSKMFAILTAIRFSRKIIEIAIEIFNNYTNKSAIYENANKYPVTVL